MDRNFKGPGDLEKAVECVEDSGGKDQTRALAREHGERAMAAMMRLSPSPERDALVKLVAIVTERNR